MKFFKKYRIHVTISIFIIVGFSLIVGLNYYRYSNVIKDEIKNITKLTSTNIYSEINNELIKPIFVSLTMANDTFLKDWLREEEENLADELYLIDLQEYLAGIEIKYQYSSVFLVSENTSNYYHYEGVYKQVNESEALDNWYYNFKDSSKIYELNVDQDAVANNELTVFVNCRIEDVDDSLLGVAGVGLKMNEVQDILSSYEDNYDLEAFLVDEHGVVQAHTNNRLIETTNIFEEDLIMNFKDQIVGNTVSMELFRYSEDGIDGYVISRYIEEMQWFLIIKKDTSVLQKTFYNQIIEDMGITIILIILILVMINQLVRKKNIKMDTLARTDQLTSLPNRRDFDEKLQHLINKDMQQASIFIFDIDNFKNINDTYGHLFGDKVIQKIASIASNCLANKGSIARWGGDEFSGIIYGDIDTASQTSSEILKCIRTEKSLSKHKISISLGLTEIQSLDTADMVIYRADKALYDAKLNGKNQVVIG